VLDPATHLRNLLRRTRAELRRKYCLHPDAPGDCSRRIISAHTVQRAILAKYIAVENHVLRFEVEPLADPVRGMLVYPKRRGINRATTFFGFCDKHDCELFRPLEAIELAFQPEQIALLGYRAICRDAYGKEAEIAAGDAARFYVMMHPDIPGFPEKNYAYQIKRLAMLNARKNFAKARGVFAKMITKGNSTDLRFFAVQFADPPMYVASAMLLPEWDFLGQQLQDLQTLDDFYPVCFSAWAAGGSAAAIFCWHVSADHVCRPFIDSLRKAKPHRLADRILAMAFEYSENVVFRSDWWAAIPEMCRRLLANRVMSGVDDGIRNARSLLDDGLRALRSAVTSKHVGY
jgi:hypothetical protein